MLQSSCDISATKTRKVSAIVCAEQAAVAPSNLIVTIVTLVPKAMSVQKACVSGMHQGLVGK